jgi:hypothetical protein
MTQLDQRGLTSLRNERVEGAWMMAAWTALVRKWKAEVPFLDRPEGQLVHFDSLFEVLRVVLPVLEAASRFDCLHVVHVALCLDPDDRGDPHL